MSVYRTIGPLVCDCTARFVSDLVGNPEDRFSSDAAHFSFQVRKYERLTKLTILDKPIGKLAKIYLW